jgi:HlyD family secretion protein
VAAAEAYANGAVATVSNAEAAVVLAKAALADTELRAPFDGVVAMLGLQVGETAGAGSIAVRLGDPSVWLVDTTDLTELNIIKLSEGSAATLTLDAIPGLTLTGKVSRIRPYGETRQGDIVYAVTVVPDRQDPRLRWNMTVKVSLETK